MISRAVKEAAKACCEPKWLPSGRAATKRRCCLSAGELQGRFERDTIKGAPHFSPSGFDGAALNFLIAQERFWFLFSRLKKGTARRGISGK
jgi:hypothetical protein